MPRFARNDTNGRLFCVEVYFDLDFLNEAADMVRVVVGRDEVVEFRDVVLLEDVEDDGASVGVAGVGDVSRVHEDGGAVSVFLGIEDECGVTLADVEVEDEEFAAGG